MILVVRNFVAKLAAAADAGAHDRCVAGSEVVTEAVAWGNAECRDARCAGAERNVGLGRVGARLHVLFDGFFADYVAGELGVPVERCFEYVPTGHRGVGERRGVDPFALIFEREDGDFTRGDALEEGLSFERCDLGVERRQDVAGRRDRVSVLHVALRLVKDRAHAVGLAQYADLDGAGGQAGERLAVPGDQDVDAERVAGDGVNVVERELIVEMFLEEDDVERVRHRLSALDVALHAHLPDARTEGTAHVERLDRRLRRFLR